jgi:hypothetical protein
MHLLYQGKKKKDSADHVPVEIEVFEFAEGIDIDDNMSKTNSMLLGYKTDSTEMASIGYRANQDPDTSID